MLEFKRIIALLLTLATLFSVVSCGEFKPAVGIGQGSGSGGSTESPGMDGDPSNDFTVQLRLNEEPYVPTVDIKVYWNDGYNIHIATVDETGMARIDGLDGDYQVTLSTVPQNCAYDSNGYIATNDNKNIVIDLYDLNLLRGKGTGLYECYEISGTGVYTVTVTDESDLSYIQFAPQMNGVYTVESWVDVSLDDVSPYCLAYLGSTQYKYGEYRVNEVGVCGSYTRNFIHTVNIADDNISSGGGGSQTFTFAVGAETKSGVYPVNLTFAIKRNGGFDLEKNQKETVIPGQDWSAFDFDAFNALAGGEIVGAETLYRGIEGCYIFDQDNYKIWEISEGGDGVYHVFDKEKYPETGGYGPILVAYITEACRYIDRSFTTIEDVGNSALIVDGVYNYRLFIKGFKGMAESGYYCVSECLCHLDGSTLACLEGCIDCHENCNQVSPEQMNMKGYADYANADGVAPVTAELARFLQGFATTQRYFADGAGWVETSSTDPIDAYEDSQWLFACGFYIN